MLYSVCVCVCLQMRLDWKPGRKGQLGAEAEAQIEGVTLEWRADVGGLCETKRSFGPERFVADCHFHMQKLKQSDDFLAHQVSRRVRPMQVEAYISMVFTHRKAVLFCEPGPLMLSY